MGSNEGSTNAEGPSGVASESPKEAEGDSTVFYWDDTTQSYYTWDNESRAFWKWEEGSGAVSDSQKQESGTVSFEKTNSARTSSSSTMLLTPDKLPPRRRVTFSANAAADMQDGEVTLTRPNSLVGLDDSGPFPEHKRYSNYSTVPPRDRSKQFVRSATTEGASRANGIRGAPADTASSQPAGTSASSSASRGATTDSSCTRSSTRSPRFFAGSHSIQLFSLCLDKASSFTTLPSSSAADSEVDGEQSDNNTGEEIFPIPLDLSRASSSTDGFGTSSNHIRSNNNLGRFLSFGKHGGLQGCIRLAHADRLSRSLTRSNGTIQDANALQQLRKAQMLLQKSGLPIDYSLDTEPNLIHGRNGSDAVSENFITRRNTQPAYSEGYPGRFNLLGPSLSGSSNDSTNLVRRDTLRDVFSNESRRQEFARLGSNSQVRTGPEKEQ